MTDDPGKMTALIYVIVGAVLVIGLLLQHLYY